MSSADEAEVPFEEAIDRIERIVAALERGESNLTDALAGFEEGVRLLNRCQGLIGAAEKSIALLTGVEETTGAARTSAFDASATFEGAPGLSTSGRVATGRAEPSTPPIEGDRDVAEDVSGRATEASTKRKPRSRPAPPAAYDPAPSGDFEDDDAPF